MTADLINELQSPQWTHGRGRSHVDVVVKLPPSAAINSLRTSLSNFAQDVGDFRDSVTFDSISLGSTNGHIDAKVCLKLLDHHNSILTRRVMYSIWLRTEPVCRLQMLTFRECSTTRIELRSTQRTALSMESSPSPVAISLRVPLPVGLSLRPPTGAYK